MAKTIIIPVDRHTTVTSYDAEGNAHARTAIQADDGGVIDQLADILVGEPIYEADGPGQRCAYVDDRISDAALAVLQDRVAAAEVRDDLPEDWQPQEVDGG